MLVASFQPHRTRKRHAIHEKDTKPRSRAGPTSNDGDMFSQASFYKWLLITERTKSPESVRIPPPPRVLRGNREGCWRCANTLITFQNGVCPRDCIADPDPRRLRLGPQFQVLRSIVITNAVSVIHGLTFDQMAAEKFLGHEDVLEDIWRSTISI